MKYTIEFNEAEYSSKTVIADVVEQTNVSYAFKRKDGVILAVVPTHLVLFIKGEDA